MKKNNIIKIVLLLCIIYFLYKGFIFVFSTSNYEQIDFINYLEKIREVNKLIKNGKQKNVSFIYGDEYKIDDIYINIENLESYKEKINNKNYKRLSKLYKEKIEIEIKMLNYILLKNKNNKKLDKDIINKINETYKKQDELLRKGNKEIFRLLKKYKMNRNLKNNEGIEYIC